MARKFVLVRGSYTRCFGIVYVYYYWGSCQEKWRQILIKYRRAPDSSIEPRTRTVSISNVIPPNQHLHDHRNGLLIRGYDRSCGKSDSPSSLMEQTHYAEMRKSKNSRRKRNFKSKWTRSLWVETSGLSNDTKKTFYEISGDYPFKSIATITWFSAYFHRPFMPVRSLHRTINLIC
jgi:hypothetical protein